MKGEISNLDLNKKAVDISEDYDLSDKMQIRLEMDIVKLAWEYYQSKLQALKEEVEDLQPESESYDYHDGIHDALVLIDIYKNGRET